MSVTREEFDRRLREHCRSITRLEAESMRDRFYGPRSAVYCVTGVVSPSLACGSWKPRHR